MNDVEDEPTPTKNGEQNEEETENFTRARELRAMFEESLAMCFEPATVGVRFASLSFLCDVLDKDARLGKISKFFFQKLLFPSL